MRDPATAPSDSFHVPALTTVAGLLVASAVLNGAGYLLNGYDRLVWYDEFCHLFTLFAITAGLGWAVLRRSAIARGFSKNQFAAAAVGAGLLLASPGKPSSTSSGSSAVSRTR